MGQHFLVDLNIARKICDALSGGALVATPDGSFHCAAPETDAAPKANNAPNGDAASDTAVVASSTAKSAPKPSVPSEASGQEADVPAGGACDVLEVGCGMGVLTRFLLQRRDIVTYGAEIDSESVAYLHDHYPEFTPRLMEGDFLRMELATSFRAG